MSAWLLMAIVTSADAGKVKLAPIDLPDASGAPTLPMSAFAIPSDSCSTSTGHLLVEVGPDSLRFGGDALETGEPSGWARDGYLLTALQPRLQGGVDARKAAMTIGCLPEDTHTVLIAVDESVAWSILASVMYTAGQAGVSRFALLVDDPEPGAPWQPPTREQKASPGVVVKLLADGIDLVGSPPSLLTKATEGVAIPCDGTCSSADAYDWPKLYEALRAVQVNHADAHSVSVMPDDNAPAVLLERTLQVVQEAHSPVLVFAAGMGGSDAVFGDVWSVPEKVKLDTEAQVSVFVAVTPELPNVMKANESSLPEDGALEEMLKGVGGVGLDGDEGVQAE